MARACASTPNAELQYRYSTNITKSRVSMITLLYKDTFVSSTYDPVVVR